MIELNASSKTSLSRTSRQEAPVDLAQVSLDNHTELFYWMQYFGTSENRLHEAVSLMGTEVARVRAYLRRFR